MSNEIPYVGTKDRPYQRLPPRFADEGLPWGAWCKCAWCGFLGRSVGLFDYYDHMGGLVCGGCLGCDQKTSMAAVEHLRDDDDPLGPGCRGGYAEELGDPPEAPDRSSEA